MPQMRDKIMELRNALSGAKASIELPNRRRLTNNADPSAVKSLVMRIESLRYDVNEALLQTSNLKSNTHISSNIFNLISNDIIAILSNSRYSEILMKTRYKAPQFFPSRNINNGLFAKLNSEGLSLDSALRLIIDEFGSQRNLFEYDNRIISEIVKLREAIPTQRVAPVIFDVKEGILVVAGLDSSIGAIDRTNADSARQDLLRSSERIIDELKNSNCDRRLIDAAKYLQENIKDNNNIIQIGLSNISCEVMCGVYIEELPAAVVAMMQAHARNVDMYAMQFPEWNRFLANAASATIDGINTTDLARKVDEVIEMLSSNKEMVSPEVPRTLSMINSLIKNPKNATKRAIFAVLRSMENLVIKVFGYAMELIEKTATKTIDEVSSKASKAVVAGLVAIALVGAGHVGGVTKGVTEFDWIKTASDIVRRQVERLQAE